MTSERYFYSVGRRKRAVASVRLYRGAGTHIVNDKPFDEVFSRLQHRTLALRPLQVTEATDSYHIQVRVAGGGISGWAGAISHGLARALVVADENTHRPLRRGGLLTRDARVKERKKPGLKRARKAPQYTKR